MPDERHARRDRQEAVKRVFMDLQGQRDQIFAPQGGADPNANIPPLVDETDPVALLKQRLQFFIPGTPVPRPTRGATTEAMLESLPASRRGAVPQSQLDFPPKPKFDSF